MLMPNENSLLKPLVGAAARGVVPVIVGTSYSGTVGDLELSRMAEFSAPPV